MDFSYIEHMDWFQLFGLPKRFIVDLEALEAAYLRAQKVVHPDVWSPLSSKSATQLSAHINMVYSGLKEPRQRAEFMLKYDKAWSVPSFQDIITEIFLLKSQENEKRFSIHYTKKLW